tara:strand:- start:149 stop:379 length:231 start_codon:yes stop_codon:yes gene_type:complete
MEVRYLKVEFGSRGEIENIEWVERFVRKVEDIVEVELSEDRNTSWYYEGYVKERLGEDWNFSDEWSSSDERIWELC